MDMVFECFKKKQSFININFLIMKKQILNLGKALSKIEQKSINGGQGDECETARECLLRNGPGKLPWECVNGYCVAGM